MICARTFSSRSTIVRFGFAQRHLVGHLENIAQRLGAFAVKPAHGQAQLVDRLDDRIDLLRQHQARQMQHRADANAGAEIRRAGGQITQLVVESVIQLLLQAAESTWSMAPQAWRSCKPGPQRLHPQVILFVDHHAEGFLAVQHQAAADAFGGVFAADEMALDQNLLVQRGQIVHRLGERILHFRQAFDRRANRFQDFDALGLFRPAGKRGVPHVARQPHAARHHDAVVRPLAARGFGRWNEKFMQVHLDVSACGQVSRLRAHLLDFIAQLRGLLEILLVDRLVQFLLQGVQAVGKVAGLAQRLRGPCRRGACLCASS